MCLGFAFCSNVSAKSPRVDLCAFWDDPGRYQGRSVRITGFLQSGEYGTSITSPNCWNRPLILQTPTTGPWRRLFVDGIRRNGLDGVAFFIELEGIFVFRTDLNYIYSNPFLMCAKKLIVAHQIYTQITYPTGYKVYMPPHGPVPPIDKAPCPLPEYE